MRSFARRERSCSDVIDVDEAALAAHLRGAAGEKKAFARWRHLLAALTVLVMGGGSAVYFMLAADVTNRQDQMSNQTAGGTALHRISFNLASGKRMQYGVGVTVRFPSTFTLAGTWTTSDFTFQDGTVRPVASVQQGAGVTTVVCSTGNADDVGVAIDTTTREFRFSPCNASFPQSSLGAMITLTVDGEAAGGTVTNPGTAGSHLMELRDAAGDCTAGGTDCQFAVAVLGNSTVSIAARVAGCGDGTVDAGETCDDSNNVNGDGCSSTCQTESSGGGGGTSTPTCATVGAATVGTVTVSGATINWSSSVNADSQVRYGLTDAYGQMTTDPALITSHALPLTSLNEKTTYHYQACSSNVSGCLACTTDGTFTTLDGTDPAFIGEVTCTPGDNSLVIGWTTDENSTSFVDWGTASGAYGTPAGSATPLATAHSVTISGLANGTLYYYRARSMDASDNEGFTTEKTCRTTTPVPPECTAACSTVTYDLYSVNPDGTERHMGTAWVRESDLGGGRKLLEFEDTSITAGNPAFDYDDLKMEVSLTDCNAVALKITSNNGALNHSVRLKVKVGGVDKVNALITDDAKASVGVPLTMDAHSLMNATCALPPVITNVKVSALAPTGATVSWVTNKSTSKWVDYGTTAGPPYTLNAGAATPLGTSHSVTLGSLTQGTTYNLRTRSKDASDREVTTGNFTFTTPETVPPVITAVTAGNITSTTARITWTTDENSDSTVLYGLTTAYGSTATNATMLTAHSLDLSGLQPFTDYNFVVKSKDKWGNEATSANFTFKTGKPAAPVITNVRAEMITESSARLMWDTIGTPSTTKVDYGLTTSYGMTASLAGLTTSHGVPISGLTQNTTYNYRVTSVDAYAQSVTSANFTFKTAADTLAPSAVTGFTAVGGDKRVTLNWTNPGDLDFAGTVIVRSTTAMPTGVTDGTPIYTGRSTTFIDENVSNDIQYFYAAFAFDEVPNYAAGAVASATPRGPVDSTAPGDVTNFTATAGDARVSLSWTKPTDTDLTAVRIVRKTANCPTGRDDGDIIYEGLDTTRVDLGVINGTTYCYAAFTRDAVPNWSTGVTRTATPTAPRDTTAPAPVTGVTVTAADAALIISWTNPADADRAGTRVVRKLGSFPTSATDGTTVYNGLANSFIDGGLINKTTYYYALFAYDASGNLAEPATGSGTPDKAAGGGRIVCADSDGGLNYDLQGSVTLDDGTVNEDSCSDGQVKEYYCDEENKSKHEMHKCDTGLKCSAGRCVVDAYQPVVSQCGNGSCEGNENSLNCPNDCPVVPEAPPVQVKPTTVVEDQRLRLEDVRFSATLSDIQLRVRYFYRTAAGTSTNPVSAIFMPKPAVAADTAATSAEVQVYNRMTFTVLIPREKWTKEPDSAFVNFAGSSYAMKLSERGYEVMVASGDNVGTDKLVVMVNYPDKTSESLPVMVKSVARPVVTGSVSDDNGQPIKDVRISLYVQMGDSFGLWGSSKSGQANPQMTDDNGRYSFVVPTGIYYLRAEKDQYYTKETLQFPINMENVITTDVALRKLPPKVEEAFKAAASGDVGKAATVVAQQAEFVARVAADSVIEAATNENVQEQAKTVVAPTMTAIAVANVATASTALPYLNYLISLLSHPLLLIARRKRRRWGVVYDALNKLPIDLAIVRLMDAKTGRIIRSAVTDKDGRYFFIVAAGEYKLAAVKPGFVFPTQYLRNVREDAEYIDLYHGESIAVKDETSITANIPLDPVKSEKAPLRVTLEGAGRRLQKMFGIATLLIMVVVFALNPTVTMGALLAGNFFFYFVFNRLAMPRKPKNWGVVYDEETDKPLSNVVVRIFESKYNKLLETQVTDIRGRYAFLVGSNVYYVTFEKPGYQKQQKGPVDFAHKDTAAPKKVEAKVVAVDIRLKAAEKGSTTTTPTAPTPSAPAAPTPAPSETPAPPVPEVKAAPEAAVTPVAPAPAPATTAVPASKLSELDFIRNLAKQKLAETGKEAQAPAPPSTAPQAPPPVAPPTNKMAELDFIRNLAKKKLEEAAKTAPAAAPTPPASTPEPSPMEGTSCPETPLIGDAGTAHPETLSLPDKCESDDGKK